MRTLSAVLLATLFGLSGPILAEDAVTDEAAPAMEVAPSDEAVPAASEEVAPAATPEEAPAVE